MRICYLIPEFPGQTHAFFWREAQELKKRGGEVVFVSTRRPPRRIKSHAWGPEAEAATSYLYPLKGAALWSTLVTLVLAGPIGWCRALWTALVKSEGGLKTKLRNAVLILMAARLVRVMKQAGCGHVHAHSCADAAMVALLANRLTGLAYSMTLHGPLADYGPNQKLKWRHARFVIIITKKLEQEARDKLAGHLPPVIRIAPMGVVMEDFVRSKAYTPYNGTGPARLFSCGRLNAVKGHRELIQAVAKLRERGLDVVVEIAGEDEQGGTGFRRELEAQIAAHGLSEKVHLLGAVDENRVKRGLEEAHAFVLASYHEPLGVAIMEAMAMQAPVITTRQGGVTELVDDGVDGLLVDAKDIDALVDQVAALLGDSALACRLSDASRAKIGERFHSGVSAAAILELARG